MFGLGNKDSRQCCLLVSGCFQDSESQLDERKEPNFISGMNLISAMDYQGAIDAFEKALEVNYALKVTRWFTFQPVFQYYFDTGASPLIRNSTVAGFRTTFSL